MPKDLLVIGIFLYFLLETQSYMVLGQNPDLETEVSNAFSTFSSTYARKYKDSTEKQKRYQYFSKNYQKLKALNQNTQGSAKFGFTHFMDWSDDEKTQFLNQPSTNYRPVNGTILGGNLRVKRQIPTSFDWRSQNVITSVKNQQDCGACWAFSTTAIAESQVAINTGQLIDLSEQELVDCENVSHGCSGGYADHALNYIKVKGLSYLANYPFNDNQGTCRNGVSPRAYIQDWAWVGSTLNESLSVVYLTQIGPLSYDIFVPDSFLYYTGGIFHLECQAPKIGGHSIAIVGYGVENGVPYWLAKNSWGTSWGDNGYLKMYRGDGSCSLLQRPMLAAIYSTKTPTTTKAIVTNKPTSATTRKPAVCPANYVYNSNTGYCYKIINPGKYIDYFTAENLCQQDGITRHLVSVHSSSENQFIYDLANPWLGDSNYTYIWTGANWDYTTQWTWKDNSNFDYSQWANKEPLNGNLYMFGCAAISLRNEQIGGGDDWVGGATNWRSVWCSAGGVFGAGEDIFLVACKTAP